MEKTTETLLSANIAVWTLVLIVGVLTMTGCGSSTGWQVNFGVHPITSIDNNQKLHYNGGAIIPADDKRRY